MKCVVTCHTAGGCRRRSVAAVPRHPRYLIMAILIPALALAGCAARAPQPSGNTAGSVPPAGATAAPPPPEFSADVTAVTAADVAQSWRPGCPVGPDQLKGVRLRYWGFDAQSHLGTIIVHQQVTADVITVFADLYRQRFPIRRITPIDSYGGSDDRSMADDNTSGFNCRNVVASGPAKWSVHAYGQAIDVNPVENPYLIAGKILPPTAAPFTDRSADRPGMAVPDGALVRAYAAVGWQWGGAWRSDPDYQHFSATGG
jgi:hypothetical protein